MPPPRQLSFFTKPPASAMHTHERLPNVSCTPQESCMALSFVRCSGRHDDCSTLLGPWKNRSDRSTLCRCPRSHRRTRSPCSRISRLVCKPKGEAFLVAQRPWITFDCGVVCGLVASLGHVAGVMDQAHLLAVSWHFRMALPSP